MSLSTCWNSNKIWEYIWHENVSKIPPLNSRNSGQLYSFKLLMSLKAGEESERILCMLYINRLHINKYISMHTCFYLSKWLLYWMFYSRTGCILQVWTNLDQTWYKVLQFHSLVFALTIFGWRLVLPSKIGVWNGAIYWPYSILALNSKKKDLEYGRNQSRGWRNKTLRLIQKRFVPASVGVYAYLLCAELLLI